MTRNKKQLGALLLALSFASAAQAEFANGSFEQNFDQWTVTGDGYLVTDDGSRTRHSYQNYQGWAGADVWFNNNAVHGSTYAVFGSQGNESVGSLTSALWTATNEQLIFSHAGNNTSGSAESNRAYGAILNAQGTELTRVYAVSYNDSQWRNWSMNLGSLGLNLGDQFQFRYVDGESWSVLDNIRQDGAALSAVENVNAPWALASLALLPLAALRRRRS